jgi:hypothetical protein
MRSEQAVLGLGMKTKTCKIQQQVIQKGEEGETRRSALTILVP